MSAPAAAPLADNREPPAVVADNDVRLAPPPAAPVPAPSNPLTLQQILFLGTGLAGSFLVNLSAQFISTNLADVQGTIGASADEASWIATVYSMASLVGTVTSGVLAKTLGLQRYMAINATLFCVAALFCVASPDLSVMVASRAVQGFAAGGFGPVAFIAVFMVMGGPRLPLGLVLLAFALLFPGTLGPVVSAFIEDGFGWQGLFAAQVLIGAALTVAACTFLPRQPMNWPGLKADWTALALLSAALALTVLVLSQGTRRFWFESEMIALCAAACLGAWAGFIFLCRYSPMPVISPRLLLQPKFGIPIALNLVFRAGFAVTSYLVPQFLAIAQGYRPLQTAQILLWAAIAQALALPVTWWLLHRLDGRAVMGVGLALCGFATAFAFDETSASAGTQFSLLLVIFGFAQTLFLAPDLLIGASSLKPADLPTASLAFNMTTLGGTTLGVALVSNFVTEREKYHSSVLTDGVSLYNSLDADRVAAMAAALGNRVVDDTTATARAVSILASAVRREAWVLSFNDAFLVVAAVLAFCAIAVIAIGRTPPLSSPRSKKSEHEMGGKSHPLPGEKP